MKHLKLLLVVLAVATIAAVPFVSAGNAHRTGNPHQFKQLSLQYAIDDPSLEAFWKHVPGNEVSGFKLSVSTYPVSTWIYLNIRTINPIPEDGTYGFTVNQENLPDDWESFWAPKEAAYPQLTGIRSGVTPIFYLHVEGGKAILLDGFLHQMNPADVTSLLRVEPQYPSGTYSYTSADLNGITMRLTFR